MIISPEKGPRGEKPTIHPIETLSSVPQTTLPSFPPSSVTGILNFSHTYRQIRWYFWGKFSVPEHGLEWENLLVPISPLRGPQVTAKLVTYIHTYVVTTITPPPPSQHFPPVLRGTPCTKADARVGRN